MPDYQEKTKDFRNYSEDNALFDRVKRTYLDMHTNQTVEYVKSMHKKWLNFDTCQMTIMDAVVKLNDLVDESDPDVDVPNRKVFRRIFEVLKSAFETSKATMLIKQRKVFGRNTQTRTGFTSLDLFTTWAS